VIRFFKNRELSQKLGVNLARWKRWSREFLPPDPLGGLQSGVARHYSIDDALTVYLGGHLVADLKFSIPEARCILEDLRSWFGATGVYLNGQPPEKKDGEIPLPVKNYIVFISRNMETPDVAPGFRYSLRGIVSRRTTKEKGVAIEEERFVERWLVNGNQDQQPHDILSLKMLNITDILSRFAAKLSLPVNLFPALKNRSI
jgi:hypothetical protein